MYKLKQPGEGFKGAGAAMETGERPGPGMEDLVAAIQKDRETYDMVRQEWQDSLGLHGSGAQIVTMTDVNRTTDRLFIKLVITSQNPGPI